MRWRDMEHIKLISENCWKINVLSLGASTWKVPKFTFATALRDLASLITTPQCQYHFILSETLCMFWLFECYLPVLQVGKSVVLTKTADYIDKLKSERQNIQDEADKLQVEIDELNSSIRYVCNPSTSTPYLLRLYLNPMAHWATVSERCCLWVVRVVPSHLKRRQPNKPNQIYLLICTDFLAFLLVNSLLRMTSNYQHKSILLFFLPCSAITSQCCQRQVYRCCHQTLTRRTSRNWMTLSCREQLKTINFTYSASLWNLCLNPSVKR